MRIIHIADIHLGQILYQNYDRVDEHDHFFAQLLNWCEEERPDALVVSGDVFDIQQPSATTKKAFTDYFVQIHARIPDMKIVITAGNHDSASRLEADNAVWEYANARLVGLSPSIELLDSADGWQEKYIIGLESGYIVALPYMNGERKDLIQSILDYVGKVNKKGKPVVMMGHTAVTGLDAEGHEVGNLRFQDVEQLGTGYDYLALGHIHKSQTLGHDKDMFLDDVTYPAGVIRYSGSALHVSCDEKYPHSVSVVDIDRHGGSVRIRRRVIDELRHFYELPLDGSSYQSFEDALADIRKFCAENEKGYIRLRVDYRTDLPANFSQMVYDELAGTNDEVRFNPKHIWTGQDEAEDKQQEKVTFQVAELQQMRDPVSFIEKTIDQYPDLDINEIKAAFDEVKSEMKLMIEEERNAAKAKADRKAAKTTATDNNEAN